LALAAGLDGFGVEKGHAVSAGEHLRGPSASRFAKCANRFAQDDRDWGSTEDRDWGSTEAGDFK
jgi:hypothetical protein